jgi:FkbM family methyltransferase
MHCQHLAAYPFNQWLCTGLTAFAYRPHRLEALYEIIRYCRETAQYSLGYQLGKAHENMAFPDDILFVDRPIHEWQFFDELSICAYWAGDVTGSARMVSRILREKKYPDFEHERILKNLSYCQTVNPAAQATATANATRSSCLVQVAGRSSHFYYRTESIGDKCVVEQIFVNCDYDISFWKPHNNALLAFMNAQTIGGRSPYIIDAGANIGASAVWFALSYHPVLIIAIEPAANNCALLKANTAELNVIVHEAAIGSEDGELFLQDPHHGDWGFRVGTTGDKKVPVMSFASLIQDIDFNTHFPMIAKIDIEGGEADLFAQHSEWLNNFALVIIELHDWMLPFAGSSRPFIQTLARYDFDILQRGENLFCFNRRLLSSYRSL